MAEASSPNGAHFLEDIKAIFRKVDLDGTGTLDTQELGTIFKDMVPDFTDGDLEELLEAADNNNDGLVDYAEFLEWVFSSHQDEYENDAQQAPSVEVGAVAAADDTTYRSRKSAMHSARKRTSSASTVRFTRKRTLRFESSDFASTGSTVDDATTIVDSDSERDTGEEDSSQASSEGSGTVFCASLSARNQGIERQVSRSQNRESSRAKVISRRSETVETIDQDSDAGSNQDLEEATVTHRRFALSAEKVVGLCKHWKKQVHPKTEEQKMLIVQGLKSCPIFLGVDFGSVLHSGPLQKIADNMEIEEYAEDDVVFNAGESARTGFLLLRGVLQMKGKQRQAGTDAGTWQVYPGKFFGEHSMLWGMPRKMTARAVSPKENVVVAKLSSEAFVNLVTRRAMKTRSIREAFIRRERMFETFSPDEISKIADTMEWQEYAQDEVIITAGEIGMEMYILLSGSCLALVNVADVGTRASIKTGSFGSAQHTQTVVKRYEAGDSFGELAFINRSRKRAATVKVSPDGPVQLLKLGRKPFERVLGRLAIMQKEHYTRDPRKTIANFYRPGSSTRFFAVYRPTSKDALSKMLDGTVVGKGLNVKGKSSKKNMLSGYVPFLQISENDHKRLVEESPIEARLRIFYTTDDARQTSMKSLKRTIQALMDKDPPVFRDGKISESDIICDDTYLPGVYGLNLPEIVMREAYIMQPDISARVGWETGRQSEPAFMDMNLHAVRDTKSEPKVVLYQFDQEDPMNPHGLLIAYAEDSVKPVVSDFDTFTVGSCGCQYQELEQDQVDMALWTLKHTEDILKTPGSATWNSRWLAVINTTQQEGFYPEIPQYGYGDPTSYEHVSEIVKALQKSGAVRHGAECFNYYFPQELDAEYLIVWFKFEMPGTHPPWEYVTEEGLRKFLLDRIDEGYCFPLNPCWAVRDPQWYEVFEALEKNKHTRDVSAAWYPPKSQLRERIIALHEKFPNGFCRVDLKEQSWKLLKGAVISSAFQPTKEKNAIEAEDGEAKSLSDGQHNALKLGKTNSKLGKTNSKLGLENLEDAPEVPILCSKGHLLIDWECSKPGVCDGCGEKLTEKQHVRACKSCDMYLCDSCSPGKVKNGKVENIVDAQENSSNTM